MPGFARDAYFEDMNAFILLCGGSSQRMQGTIDDKILALLAGKPVFLYSLEAFSATKLFTQAIIVYRDENQKNKINTLLQSFKFLETSVPLFNFSFIAGGKRRQDSVMAGLKVLNPEIKYVHIHDAARPFVPASMITLLQKRIEHSQAGLLAARVTDTIKEQSILDKNSILTTISRENLWIAQTPQAFEKSLLEQAYAEAQADNLTVTDDASVVENLGHPIDIVENAFPNSKLTYPVDFGLMEAYLKIKNKHE